MAKKVPANPGRAGKKKKPKPTPASKHDGKNKDPAGLTPMQAAFVNHYTVHRCATMAAKEAKYSEKTAQQQGYQLLQLPSVKAAISEKFRLQNERLDIRADRILLEIYRLATVDIGEAYDDEGKLKNIKDIPEDVRRAISSFETETEITVPAYGAVGSVSDSDEEPDHDGEAIVTRKIKFVDKNKSLEMLAKHFKLLTESLEVKGKITLEQLVAAAGQADEPDA